MVHPYKAYLTRLHDAPDDLLVIHGERRLSRGQLGQIAGGIARKLEQMKIVSTVDLEQPRVLICLPNSPEMMALILAVWAQGGLPMLLSPKSPSNHLRYIQSRHHPELVVDEMVLRTLLGSPNPLPEREISGDVDASAVFTSGSTGTPKGVVQKGITLSSSTCRISEDLGYTSHERILVPIPMSHDYGWNQMLAGLVCGHTIILPDNSSLIEVSRAIDKHKPSVVAGVPSLYTGLLMGVSGFESVDTSNVRMLISTGSPFSSRLYQMLKDRVPDARILLNYGLTETFRSCCLRPEDLRDSESSLGRPVKGVEIIIVDENGRELPPKSEGEIVHVGAGSFDRYLDDLDKTRQTRSIVSDQPAVATGDIGYLDTSGYVYFIGRRDRLVKVMDINVSLNEVENIIASLDGVEEVAVISRGNIFMGKEIIALCVLQADSTQSEIKQKISLALPAHMQPRKIYTGATLPRTSLGKVDYPAVQKLCKVLSV
ncbi:MAG: class I adenylate-forming enzyme family protein [Kordiimonas sp.]